MDLDSDHQKEIAHQNDPSLHDSAPFVVLDQDKEQTLVASDIEALYRVEEDPAKPPLQVPVYLFANTSIEEVGDKNEQEEQEQNEESHSNTDLLEQMKNQMLTSLQSQTDDNSSVESGMLIDEDVGKFLQTMAVGSSEADSPRQQIIAIIQESDDENDLEMDEDMTEDVLKKFVVDSTGIQTSASSSQDGESSNDPPYGSAVQLQLPKSPAVFREGDGPGHQVIIFASDDSIPAGSGFAAEGQAVESITDAQDETTVRKDPADEHRRISKHGITVIGQDNAGEVLKDIPLDMTFEVVGEVMTAEGDLLMREITTQTRPAKRPRSYRKRKLKDCLTESPAKMHAYGSPGVDHEVVISQSGVVRAYDMHAKKYKCTKCTLRFHTVERCNIHIRCHQGSGKNYLCYYCGHTESQWMKMYHHLFQHGVEKPHKCDQCAFSCINRSDLSAHMAVHSNSKDWHCTKCGRPFKHRRNMVAHLRSCPGLDESGKPAQRPEEEEKFICGICQKTLSTKKNLEKHMEIHLDLKPFVCDHCGHSTRLKESLIMHKRLHTGEKPYKCKVCDYATPDKSSLRRHNRIHTNDKPYKCQHCNYKCIQKHCLDTHIRRKHTGEQFVCGLCHYATHDRYGLNQHFKRHQNPDGTLDASLHEGGSTSASSPQNAAPTLITLSSGAVLTSTVIDGGKTTLIAEAAKTEEPSQNLNQVFLRIDDGSALQRADTSKDDTTGDQSEQQSNSLDTNTDKNEEATIQLGRLETDLLQEIQQPGDEVFLQPSGEIVIRRRDGHLLVIQQQEADDDGTEFSLEQRDGEEYLTAASPDEVSNAAPESAQEEDGGCPRDDSAATVFVADKEQHSLRPSTENADPTAKERPTASSKT